MACEKPVVRVKQGDLRGVVEENVYGGKFLAFRGIPYAKAPVGPLRFKDPEPAESWTGTRDASKFGGECAQIDIFTHKFIGGDDCLYLNVYKPINDSPKRAVMVWIHGGGFINGSGNDTVYGPDYLIRKDIVLVTINYRVGVLGFLNLEHEVAPGNQGLKDQVMALKWVQENISSFGGDPNNVTIFGESAGGASVHYLTISPLAEGLFHKAISQSGVAANPWAIITKEPSKFAYQLAAIHGENSTDPATVVEFLRNIDAEKLVNSERQLFTPEMNITLLTAFGPGVDKKSTNPFLPEHPLVLMQSRVKVPYILGHNSNEGSFFMNPTMFKNATPENFDKLNQNFQLAIHPETMIHLKKDGITANDLKRLYFGDRPVGKETLQEYANLLSDVMFLHGIYNVVKNQLEKDGPPIYFYKFTLDDESSAIKHLLNVPLSGATHSEELSYLFYSYIAKQFHIPPLEPGSDKYRIMEYFTQMWTDFAKTGNPTAKTTDLITTTWKPLEKGNVYNYINIDKTLEMQTTTKEDQRFEWKIMRNKL